MDVLDDDQKKKRFYHKRVLAISLNDANYARLLDPLFNGVVMLKDLKE